MLGGFLKTNYCIYCLQQIELRHKGTERFEGQSQVLCKHWPKIG